MKNKNKTKQLRSSDTLRGKEKVNKTKQNIHKKGTKTNIRNSN